MSQATPSPPVLDLREQIVRIDRAIAETQKFQAETNRLTAVGGIAALIASLVTAARALGAF